VEDPRLVARLYRACRHEIRYNRRMMQGFACRSLVTMLVLLAATAFPRMAAQAGRKIGPDCALNGHKLYGKIQVVKAFPDLKVKIVSAFPDLKVQVVDNFPDKCGQWKMVDTFPDLKIQFVESFPDLTIKRVGAFPGVP
jgi:hypothetical protein